MSVTNSAPSRRQSTRQVGHYVGPPRGAAWAASGLGARRGRVGGGGGEGAVLDHQGAGGALRRGYGGRGDGLGWAGTHQPPVAALGRS